MKDWLKGCLTEWTSMHWQREDWKRLLHWGLLLVGLGVFVLVTELGINRTDSLPYSVFLTVKGLKASKGDLVSIRGHQTKYYPRVTFTKRIVGQAGDEVSNVQGKMWINGVVVGKVLEKTSFGRPLTPLISRGTSTVIPEGHVFVMTDHERSFDSRYQEFGLVPVAALQGRAFVLW